jgi:hypothetical protein
MILDNINFVKIKISSPWNTKSETQMQVYTLCTCHETTQVGPPNVFSHVVNK